MTVACTVCGSLTQPCRCPHHKYQVGSIVLQPLPEDSIPLQPLPDDFIPPWKQEYDKLNNEALLKRIEALEEQIVELKMEIGCLERRLDD